jgi:hypothetical protein
MQVASPIFRSQSCYQDATQVDRSMFTKLSEDIKALLNFELERGNEVFNFGAGDGYNFIELRLPFHTSDMGFKDVLVDTIHPWEWGSQHYDDQYDGFRSSIFPYDAIVVRRRKEMIT